MHPKLRNDPLAPTRGSSARKISLTGPSYSERGGEIRGLGDGSRHLGVTQGVSFEKVTERSFAAPA